MPKKAKRERELSGRFKTPESSRAKEERVIKKRNGERALNELKKSKITPKNAKIINLKSKMTSRDFRKEM